MRRENVLVGSQSGGSKVAMGRAVQTLQEAPDPGPFPSHEHVRSVSADRQGWSVRFLLALKLLIPANQKINYVLYAPQASQYTVELTG